MAWAGPISTQDSTRHSVSRCKLAGSRSNGPCWEEAVADNSCTPTLDGLVGYDEAVQRLVAKAGRLGGRREVGLREALGEVLAESVISRIDVPGWDYSAMDGYAVRADECASAPVTLPVSQRVPAGAVPSPLAEGTAARIFTGAPIPPGADSIVMQEVCEALDTAVTIGRAVENGENIRRRGEDIALGSEVIAAGTRLAPQHIGLAAAVGIDRLSVVRRPRVALFASGDELVMPGEPLPPGKIYNSNLFTATALLQALGCEVVDLGIVEDSLDATRTALADGASQADLVLASGGVSVGEEDHVKPAVESLGSLDMWRLAIRPGKPLAFGHIGDVPFIGSPGNPVSLFVTFLLFVRPYILRLQGREDWQPVFWRARADFDWPRPDRRREFHRGRAYRCDDGQIRVAVHPSRSSGVLSSVTWANGLVVLPESQKVVAGEEVDFLPFCELLS
ncbi:MAG: molybdopterin molybdotransferase MoeA [Gammaproteobacteria bacterium]|nr:molybdopterin molybdotransferase MoeA [Gammaproteobacteria bacterium]